MSVHCSGDYTALADLVIQCLHHHFYEWRYEFNVDSKAECGQHNLAHVARNKKSIRKKLKQTPVPT